MAPRRRRQKRQQKKNTPSFRISPSTNPVQRWAVNLLSPSAQDVQVAPWYVKAAAKAETRVKEKSRQKSTAPAPLAGRYNLRIRPRVQPTAEPLKSQSPLKRSGKNKKGQLDDTPLPPITRTGTRYNLRSAPHPQPQPPEPINQMPNPQSAAGAGANRNQRKRARIDPVDVSQSGEAPPVFSDQGSAIPPSQVRETSNIPNSTTTRQTTHVERRSGMQRLINLMEHKPQFIYHTLLEDSPETVQELCGRLRNAAHHYEGVVPRDLQSWITRDYPLEAFPDGMWGASSTRADEKRAARDLYKRVEYLYQAMMRKNGVNPGSEEAAWYGIIENALGQFKSNPPQGNDLNFRNLTSITCTTHAIFHELLPYDSGTGNRTKSAKVDLFIGYDQMRNPWRELLARRGKRRLDPIHLTPLQGLEKTFIGVIPIEVKNATGDSIDARYQLALCASGMLRLRQVWSTSGQQKKKFDPNNPPVVVGISIIGHIWSYYVIFLGTPDDPDPMMEPLSTQDYHHLDSIPRVVLGPFMAGHTMGIQPTCQLFHFLTVLRDWVVTEWAPVVYEELAATAPAASTAEREAAAQSTP